MTEDDLDRLFVETADDVSLSEPPQFPGERKDLLCAECGQPMQLRSSRFGPFYGCTTWPNCEGTHGAHPDGAPKGIPADKPTRLARIRAHTVFDRIWKSKAKKRHQAYGWMRQAMGLSHSEAHIAMFSIEQCEKLIQLVYRDFPQFRTRYSSILYDDFDD